MEENHEWQDIQAQFEALCEHRLNTDMRGYERICARVALAMLEGFTPNIEGLSEESAQRAGCLLEFTANMARRQGSQALEILRQVHSLKSAISAFQAVTFYPSPTAPPRMRFDPLANQWGLLAGLHPVELKYRIRRLELTRRLLNTKP